MDLDDEARVTVNGVELTPQQSATLRVALAGFLHELADDQFRMLLGPIGEAYRTHASAIQDLIMADIQVRRESKMYTCKTCRHSIWSHQSFGEVGGCYARPGPSSKVCFCDEFIPMAQ